MTMIPKHDLDIMKIYLYAKNEATSSRCSKVIAQRVIYALTLTFDLDPMTLILKPDLAIMEIYLHAKNESRGSRGSKVIAKKHFDLDL